MIVFGQKWFYSEKVVVLEQSGCIRSKVIPFGKSCCIPEENGCYRAKCFYSGKSCCVQVIEVIFGQMWLYSCKEVVFGQSGCVHAKWFYSGKVVVFGQK